MQSSLITHLENESWRYAPHTYAKRCSGERFKIYPHIKFIADRIVPGIYKGGGRFIVTVPPRHGKSEFISKWIPSWFLDTFDNQNVILTSYGDSLATSFGRHVRNHFETNELTVAKLATDAQAASFFATDKGGSMFTAGVGGPITGKGGHLLIIDDPFKNWEEASSEVMRMKVKDWFDSTFYTRMEPNATIIVLQTRWNHDDLAGYLLNEHPDKWDLINLPAIAEEDDQMGRAPGEALCPERYSIEILRAYEKAIPSQKFVALYQQKPSKDGGEIFNRKWWQYYEVVPLNIVHKVQFWDTAQKPGLTNDFSVCATWGKTPNGYYLLDLFRAKLEAPDLEQAIVQQYNKWRPNAVQIEDKSSGSSLIQYCRRNTTIPIIAYDPKQRDKENRAIDATPMIKSGLCFLPKNAPWLNDFITEHDQFPVSKHDDQVDTTSQMSDYFRTTNTYQPRVRNL